MSCYCISGTLCTDDWCLAFFQCANLISSTMAFLSDFQIIDGWFAFALANLSIFFWFAYRNPRALDGTTSWSRYRLSWMYRKYAWAIPALFCCLTLSFASVSSTDDRLAFPFSWALRGTCIFMVGCIEVVNPYPSESNSNSPQFFEAFCAISEPLFDIANMMIGKSALVLAGIGPCLVFIVGIWQLFEGRNMLSAALVLLHVLVLCLMTALAARLHVGTGPSHTKARMWFLAGLCALVTVASAFILALSVHEEVAFETSLQCLPCAVMIGVKWWRSNTGSKDSGRLPSRLARDDLSTSETDQIGQEIPVSIRATV